MEKVSIDSNFLTINQPILYRQRRSWPAMGLRRILHEAKILYVLDNENNHDKWRVAVCELRSLKTKD
jgi:hypothetical protein